MIYTRWAAFFLLRDDHDPSYFHDEIRMPYVWVWELEHTCAYTRTKAAWQQEEGHSVFSSLRVER